MQHCKALRTRTWFAISLILGFVMVGFGCTSGGSNTDFIYEGTDTITILRYNGAGGDVVIPSQIKGKPVTGIGEFAFALCDSLTGITIPDTVTSIGNNAFYICNNLTSVNIPAGVTCLGDKEGEANYAFVFCDSLTAINVDAANTMYSSEDGILYNKAKTTLIQYPARKTATAFTLPNGVTKISDFAFYACDSLPGITIPDIVTSIGDRAFNKCASLTAINVDAGNAAYSSQNGVLYNKNRTALITFPPGKTETTFAIPDGVTDIGDSAFIRCANLTGVIIPNSVPSIGVRAFQDCTSLTSVTIPNSITSIEHGAFFGCTSLTGITIPDSVTSIGKEVFYNCTSLTAITIDTANTVYISEDGVLYNKAKTALIQYPAGKTAAVFTIPDSVTSIEYEAFDHAGLTSVIIPNSVTSIGHTAFSNSGLTSITIPNSVTSIEGMAFYNCASLTNVTIPDSITEIEVGVFADCTSLTGITIPDSVTIIKNDAFGGCTSLASVTIPNSVTSIESFAFTRCTNLESVTFEGAIASDNFGIIYSYGIFSPFDGDLRDRYLTGGTRTYTTTAPVTESSKWAMQESILKKLIRMALL